MLEMAEALVQSEIDEGIRRARQDLPIQPPDFDGHCVDCDEPIPEKRLAFGATTCVSCQYRREQQKRIMRR